MHNAYRIEELIVDYLITVSHAYERDVHSLYNLFLFFCLLYLRKEFTSISEIEQIELFVKILEDKLHSFY
jgi:hypothetical protein